MRVASGAMCTTRAATAIARNVRPAPRRRGSPRAPRELLPVPYFHLVFTLPHALNPLAAASPRRIYELLFRAVSETLLEFAADFLAQYRNQLSSDHLRALAAMRRCRTQASAKMQVQCTGCAHQTLVPHSCGHRHCPHCQHHESQQWLERQLKRLVPQQSIPNV